MAKAPLTEARNITADEILKLGKLYSAQELRGMQSKLTGAAREVRALTGNKGLIARIGELLTHEQRRLLRDAASLVDSVNTNLEHAKEKRQRDEKDAKRRQNARDIQAKQLIAAEFPLPHETLDQKLEILKIALTFNRAGVFELGYSNLQYNQHLRSHLANTHRLIGWNSPKQYWASCVTTLRCDFIQELTHDIRYDDGSSVEDRLNALKQKAADRLSQIPLTAEEQETLRLWTEALSPSQQQEGA